LGASNPFRTNRKAPFYHGIFGFENKNYHESDLQQALIDNLQEFLLEIGKGFSFAARQKRISIDGGHYYTDLVFYNDILKCFVVIDLKTGKLRI
jgi:predicted nuclease of restriction endonuclease-like (RecB) superfamily